MSFESQIGDPILVGIFGLNFQFLSHSDTGVLQIGND